MIHLEEITEKNFRKVINLKVAPGQEKFVAANLYSIAQAWLYYGEARPMVIMNDDEPVGFLMIDWDVEERTAGIWRFMIAAEHQRKGFGRAALLTALDMIKEANQFDLVHLSYVPGNTAARDLYYSVGFRESGEIDDDEIIMILPLTDKPKVVMTIAYEDDVEEICAFLEGERIKPSAVSDTFSEDKIREGIKNKTILKFLLMGNIIGLSDGINTFVSSEYENYHSEVLEKVKENNMLHNL
jgi:diamine N-acetyltransferase